MGYTFISYSTKNQSEGDAVRNLFHKKGIRTWMAPYNIPIGSGYASEITQAIKNCACFVLLLSKSSQDSMWVDKEVERALYYKKSVIVIQLEDIILNDSFEFYLGNCQIQSVKKIDENAEGFRKILDAVIALAGTDAPVAKKTPAVKQAPPQEEFFEEEREVEAAPKGKSVPIELTAGQNRALIALRCVDALSLLLVVLGVFLLIKVPNVYVSLSVFIGAHILLSIGTIAETMILTKAKKKCGGTEDADTALSVLILLHLALGITCIVFFFLNSVFTLYAFALTVTVLAHYLVVLAVMKGEWKDIAIALSVVFGILTLAATLVHFL